MNHTTIAPITIVPYADDPRLDTGTKAFLKVLNAGGAPLKTLSKEDARNVLVQSLFVHAAAELKKQLG